MLVGGWDAGTAEDLDMTQRLKQHFGKHPAWRIVFDPRVTGQILIKLSVEVG